MKIFTTILLLTIFLTPLSIYAQDTPERSTDEATVTDVQVENTEDTPTEELEVDTEGQIEEGTLSEDVTLTQTSNITFGGILLAIFTPLLLIVIAYLLIKMSNK
jgi:hypothetical protein